MRYPQAKEVMVETIGKDAIPFQRHAAMLKVEICVHLQAQSKFTTFTSHAAQRRRAPNTDEPPHADPPSSPQAFPALSLSLLRISSSSPYPGSRVGFVQIRLETSFAFFIYNGPHSTYQALVWAYFNHSSYSRSSASTLRYLQLTPA